MNSTKGLFIFILVLFSAATSFAETVVLKSGKVIEGKIVEKNDDSIKIDSGSGVAITYYLDEIKTMDGQDTASKNAPDAIKIKSKEDNPIENQPVLSENVHDEADEVKKIEGFLHQVADVGRRYSAGYAKTTKMDMSAQSKEEKKNAVLQSIEVIKTAIKELEVLETPDSCQHYKELIIKQYEQMIEGEKMHLQIVSGSLLDAAKAGMSFEKKTNEMKSAGDLSNQEYYRIIKKYNITEKEW